MEFEYLLLTCEILQYAQNKIICKRKCYMLPKVATAQLYLNLSWEWQSKQLDHHPTHPNHPPTPLKLLRHFQAT